MKTITTAAMAVCALIFFSFSAQANTYQTVADEFGYVSSEDHQPYEVQARIHRYFEKVTRYQERNADISNVAGKLIALRNVLLNAGFYPYSEPINTLDRLRAEFLDRHHQLRLSRSMGVRSVGDLSPFPPSAKTPPRPGSDTEKIRLRPRKIPEPEWDHNPKYHRNNRLRWIDLTEDQLVRMARQKGYRDESELSRRYYLSVLPKISQLEERKRKSIADYKVLMALYITKARSLRAARTVGLDLLNVGSEINKVANAIEVAESQAEEIENHLLSLGHPCVELTSEGIE